MIPVFASHILDRNRGASTQKHSTIRLKSILLGNGLTDVVNMVPTYYDMMCTAAGIPFASISSCVKIKAAVSAFLKFHRPYPLAQM